VVINHEEQYSLWYAERAIPSGWRAVGVEGSKRDCLDYVDEVWTDIRPKEFRKQMDAIESLGW